MSDARGEASRLNDAGRALADERRYAEALALYEQAIALAPTWHAPHVNVGIACKHTGEWARSLAASLRAVELDAEKAGSGPLWNAGVAATALGDWPRARWAWTRVGIELPPGDGPIDLNIGMTPIRVCCDQRPEVVWCHRIDPARALIESIPTPESGRRYHDLLLHDGEPKGKRPYGKAMRWVFDELTVLEPSLFETWSVDVRAPTPADLDALFESVAEATHAALEDWTASLELLCKACSEGVPHEHTARPESAWRPERTIAVATPDDAVFRRIEEWAAAGRGRASSAPVFLLC